ncbi:MAG TPA: ABC transporter ATP-binding protein, partial [Allocoleopsis sp.]
MAGKKRALLLLAILFLLVSLLEAVGIGLVGPFIALATNRKLIYQNPNLDWAYTHFGFSSDIQFVGLFGLGIVGILYLKSFLGFSIQKYIFEFGFSQQADLRSKLMHAYLRVPYIFHLNRNTAISIQTIVNETQTFANGILMPALFSTSNLTVVLFLTILLLKTNLVATAS